MARRFLIIVLLITALVVSACSSGREKHVIRSVSITPSGEKIATTIENTWTANATAVAERNYVGAWNYHDQRTGGSILVRLSRHDHSVGSFDGNSFYEIAFQLPLDISVGKTMHLRPIPKNRPTRKAQYNYDVAEMRDGEIAAMRFGNPRSGTMTSADVATVKLLSLDAKQAVIHLKLKATLDNPSFEFDFDEPFTLAVVPLKIAIPQAAPN
jgi:hypothetical protein